MNENIIVNKYRNGPFGVNTYLIYDKNSKEGIVIDPGDDISKFLKNIGEMDINLKAILVTHGHIDHLSGVTNIKNKFEIPVYMSKADENMAHNIHIQAKLYDLDLSKYANEVQVDFGVKDEEVLEIGDFKIKVIATPGHSKGSVCYLIDNRLFSGDTLFKENVGRTDLYAGNHDELLSSIRDKLFILPAETEVHPGHGKSTTIENEKKVNPYIEEEIDY